MLYISFKPLYVTFTQLPCVSQYVHQLFFYKQLEPISVIFGTAYPENLSF